METNWMANGYFFYIVLLALIIATTSLELSIEKKYMHTQPNESKTVVCKTSDMTRLTNCQFRILYYNENRMASESKVYNLSDKSRSDVHKNTVFTLNYFGGGLDNGECGGNLTVHQLGKYILSCRARGVNKYDWEMEFMTLLATDKNTLEVYVEPVHTVYVQNNRTIRIVKCASPANTAISQCSLDLGRRDMLTHVATIKPSDSATSGHYSYSGNSLSSGVCEVTIAVTEEDNGVFLCTLDTEMGRGLRGFALVYQIKPSDQPELTLGNYFRYQGSADYNVRATCTVSDSRPAATITWFKDGKVIEPSPVDDLEETWRWPWDRGTTTQQVTIPLDEQDNGKVLTCQVNHVTFTTPSRSKVTIQKPNDQLIKIIPSTTSKPPATTTPATTATTATTATSATTNTSMTTLLVRPMAADAALIPVVVVAGLSLGVLVASLIWAKRTRRCCFSRREADSNVMFITDKDSFNLQPASNQNTGGDVTYAQVLPKAMRKPPSSGKTITQRQKASQPIKTSNQDDDSSSTYQHLPLKKNDVIYADLCHDTRRVKQKLPRTDDEVVYAEISAQNKPATPMNKVFPDHLKEDKVIYAEVTKQGKK